LKLFQIITRKRFTFAAKVDATFCRTNGHFALATVRQPFFRTTPVALALFLRPISFGGKPFDPFRVLGSGNKPRAGFTIKAAHSRHLFVRITNIGRFSFHLDSGQILHHFSKREFFETVHAAQAERGAEGFNCWDPFAAMLFPSGSMVAIDKGYVDYDLFRIK